LIFSGRRSAAAAHRDREGAALGRQLGRADACPGHVDNDAAPELEIAIGDGAVPASACSVADFIV